MIFKRDKAEYVMVGYFAALVVSCIVLLKTKGLKIGTKAKPKEADKESVSKSDIHNK